MELEVWRCLLSTRWQLSGANVDWITVTCEPGPNLAPFLTLGSKIIMEEVRRGNAAFPGKFNGYIGASSLHVFTGFRPDGACIRLGSSVARRGWRVVHQSGTHVTRMDLAVTALSSPVNRSYAVEEWDAIRLRTGVEAAKVEHTSIQTLSGGSSLYCGKRASPRYGRIYDKHAESPRTYRPGAWRWEVEYKSALAGDVARWLATRADEPVQVVKTVGTEFERWGIDAPWAEGRAEWKPRDERSPTTAETKYRWLRETVAATIASLSPYYSADQLVTALGLGVSHQGQPLIAAIAHFNEELHGLGIE